MFGKMRKHMYSMFLHRPIFLCLLEARGKDGADYQSYLVRVFILQAEPTSFPSDPWLPSGMYYFSPALMQKDGWDLLTEALKSSSSSFIYIFVQYFKILIL